MNYDNNVVGWYQSSYCGAICTNDVILQQQQYQTSVQSPKMPSGVIFYFSNPLSISFKA
jgi:hypothetical protein